MIINNRYTMTLQLTPTICRRFFQINHPSRLMVFISTPETTTWISLSKSRMHFKHFLSAVRLQHNLRILQRVPFWNVHRKVNMISSKTEVSELESKPFEFTKSLGTGIDMGLFSKTVIPAFGVKLHHDPVVSCVMRWLFIASATFIGSYFLLYDPLLPFQIVFLQVLH